MLKANEVIDMASGWPGPDHERLGAGVARTSAAPATLSMHYADLSWSPIGRFRIRLPVAL